MPPQGTTRIPLSLLAPVAVAGLVILALLVLFPTGFPNYDSVYYLLWGRELAEGMSPDYGPPWSRPPTPSTSCSGRWSHLWATERARRRWCSPT